MFLLPGPSGELAVNISDYWSDQHGIGITGWVSTEDQLPQDLELVQDGAVVTITSWFPRPDLAEKQPSGFRGKAWGFRCYLPTNTTPLVKLRRRGSLRRDEHEFQLRRHPRKLPSWHKAHSATLLEEFIAQANRAEGNILEIGSRQVCAGGQGKRALFPNCAYTGFDYYKDENTDVVGDAHRLSNYFSREFDAVFSLAVLEHLAMPWVVAAEINKVLKPGGLTFHSTHFAFPVHERPWDFWRYTDQSLRVLFSPPLGFEVVRCEFDTPARMHPDTPREDLLGLPLEAVWVGISVLARKTADIDPTKFVWSASVAECLGSESAYPAPSGSHGVG